MQANDVASIILSRSGPWTDAMRLQKLLYYVQAWHLAVTDEPLFDEQIKAWKDGPVVPQVWHERKHKATRRSTEQNVDDLELDQLTSNLIDLVISSYGSMSGEELSALTHVEQPWKEARGDLAEDADGRTPIAHESMASYYRAHRLLGGRTAADLAAGGIDTRDARRDVEPIDVDAIFRTLGPEFTEPGDDPWGGANLQSAAGFESGDIENSATRIYAGA